MNLVGVRQKLARAEEHIATLESVVTDFCTRYRYTWEPELEPDPQSGFFGIRFRREQPPEIIPLLLGDAVHNLRSALDHLACELVLEGGGRLTSSTQFPFSETSDRLASRCKTVLAGARPEIIDFIRDQIQPWGQCSASVSLVRDKVEGNWSLCAVHRLDVFDKHRLILPVVSTTAFGSFLVENSAGDRFVAGCLPTFKEEAYIPTCSPLPIARVPASRPYIGLVFGREHPGSGLPVVEITKILRNNVTMAIDQIAEKLDRLKSR